MAGSSSEKKKRLIHEEKQSDLIKAKMNLAVA
jgi:hypothetical protein